MAGSTWAFFMPVLPNDSSAINLARAHGNLSNLWVFAAILFAETRCYDQFYKARSLATQHGIASQWFLGLARLEALMEMLNRK